MAFTTVEDIKNHCFKQALSRDMQKWGQHMILKGASVELVKEAFAAAGKTVEVEVVVKITEV